MYIIFFSILFTISGTVLLHHCSPEINTKVNSQSSVVASHSKDSGKGEFKPEKRRNFWEIFGDIYSKDRLAIPEGITPIPRLDLDKYYGRWYEIARLNHRFEKGLTEVMAEYSKLDNGDVRVKNTGYYPGDDSLKIARGKARYVDPNTHNGHLKVSFFGPFFSSYVVFYIEHEDPKDLKSRYNIALVSGNNRNYCWVLSRSPHISKEKWKYLLDIIKKNGFETDGLIMLKCRPTHLLNKCDKDCGD